MCAQIQGLWITAYFDNKLQTPQDPISIQQDTILHNRFLQWRYSKGHGDRFPDMVFDILPYFDMLLSDLGLESHRKKNLVAELFFPYGQKDYVGLVQEWLVGSLQLSSEPDMCHPSAKNHVD